MGDKEKIERAKSRIEFTIEAINRIIADEQHNLDRYKDLCEKNQNKPFYENVYYASDLNISRSIINLESLKNRLVDTLKELND